MKKKILTGVLVLMTAVTLAISPAARAIAPQQTIVEAAKKAKAKKVTLKFGETKKLKASKVKKWTSSNKKVVSVSKKGVVTPKKAGKATITAKLKNGKTQKFTVTVPAMKISSSSANLEPGKTLNLTVRNAKNVTWSSSNSNVAKVENGLVTAVDEGTATITAAAGAGKVTCAVTVKDNTVINQPAISYNIVTRQAQVGHDLVDERLVQATVKFNGLPKNANHMKKINRGDGNGNSTNRQQDGKYLTVACALAAMTAYSEGRNADGKAMMDVLMVSPHISQQSVGSAGNLTYYFGYDDKKAKLPWAFFDGSTPGNYNHNQPIAVTLEEYPYAPQLSTIYGVELQIEKIQFHTSNHPCLTNNLTVQVYQDPTDKQWYLWPSGFASLVSTASIK